MKTVKNPVSKEDTKANAKKENAKKAKHAKPEKSTAKVDEILNPTAEQRIRKIKNFQLLADKHDFLKQKADQLENFMVSSDGTKEKITLSNAKGFHFEVANTQVIEEVLEVLKKRLSIFIEASEKEVLQYSI